MCSSSYFPVLVSSFGIKNEKKKKTYVKCLSIYIATVTLSRPKVHKLLLQWLNLSLLTDFVIKVLLEHSYILSFRDGPESFLL